MGPQCVPVSESSQVGEARRRAARVAEEWDLGETECGQVSIVATELANNLARYGKNGQLFVQGLRTAAGSCVELLAVDSGPGMTDVAQCLEDGFSTGGTPGTGLGAVRRMSAEFDIYSIPNVGTAVLARIAAHRGGPVAKGFEWGALSTCAPGEQICGDSWRVEERSDHLAIMVADGLGHGPLANAASELATSTFGANAALDPSRIMTQAHTALMGGRGAAVAIARLAPPVLTYSGVGNISGSLQSGGKGRGLFSHNGTVGVQMRAAQQLTYDWTGDSVLVMHSDGLTARWSFSTYPGLMTRHPAIIAGVLHRDCLRGRDDATVVVVRGARDL